MDDDQHFSTTLLTCLSTFQKCETVAISVSQKLSNSESIDFNDLLGKWIDSRFQKNSARGSFLKKTILIQQTKNV